MKEILNAINIKIGSFSYLEFCIYSYDKQTLTIVGSEDLLYFHNFEIIFLEVFTMSLNNDWKVDTSKLFLDIVEGTEESINLNRRYRVEIGNTIFRFHSEDEVEMYVIAKDIIFNDHLTKYHLNPGRRP